MSARGHGPPAAWAWGPHGPHPRCEGKEAKEESGGRAPFQNLAAGLVLSSHHFSQGPETRLGSIGLGVWGCGSPLVS